jgi:hypothetical protein
VKVADDYFEEIDKKSKENEGLISQGSEPIWDVEDGRGFWTHKRCKPTDQMHRLHLEPEIEAVDALHELLRGRIYANQN